MTTPPDDAIIAQSGYTHPGFAERYERYRPQPPAALVGLLTQYAGGDRPHLVVDLGSGTGQSSFLWAEHARAVVGVEPNPAMRQVAETRLAARGLHDFVRFLGAYAQDTGLPTGAADIVTCSQAFHWMNRSARWPRTRAGVAPRRCLRRVRLCLAPSTPLGG